MNAAASTPATSTPATSPPVVSPALVAAPSVPEISAWRLNLLRLAYAIMAVGLATFVWPSVFSHTAQFAAESGVRCALLAGLGLTAALGLRYPLQMLPVLLFELIWKSIYLLAFALPLYLSHQLTGPAADDTFQVLMVVIFLPLIPWRYVIATYLAKRGERWK